MANEIQPGPQVVFGNQDVAIGSTTISTTNTQELIKVTPGVGYQFYNPNNGSIPQITAIVNNAGYIYNSKTVQNLPAWFKLSTGALTTFLNLTGGGGKNDAISTALELTNSFSIKFDMRMSSDQLSQTNKYILGVTLWNGDFSGGQDHWNVVYGFHAGKLEFFNGSYTGTDDPDTQLATITATDFHNYEIIYDGTNLSLKIDGTQTFTVAKSFSADTFANIITAHPTYTTKQFHLGTRISSTATVAWNGDIKNVVVKKAGTTVLNLPLASNGNDTSGNALNVALSGSYTFA